LFLYEKNAIDKNQHKNIVIAQANADKKSYCNSFFTNRYEKPIPIKRKNADNETFNTFFNTFFITLFLVYNSKGIRFRAKTLAIMGVSN